MERYLILYACAENQEMAVNEAISDQGWLIPILSQPSEEALEQLQLLAAELVQVQNSALQHDEMGWKWDKEGKFTVKSYYKAYEERPYIGAEVAKIWLLKEIGRAHV